MQPTSATGQPLMLHKKISILPFRMQKGLYNSTQILSGATKGKDKPWLARKTGVVLYRHIKLLSKLIPITPKFVN